MSSFLQPLHPFHGSVSVVECMSQVDKLLSECFLLEEFIPTRRFLQFRNNFSASVAGSRNLPCYSLPTAELKSASFLTDRLDRVQTICSSTRLSGRKHNLSSFFGPFAQIFQQHFWPPASRQVHCPHFVYGGHMNTSHVPTSSHYSAAVAAVVPLGLQRASGSSHLV